MNTESQIKKTKNGFSVSGPVHFNSVSALRKAGQACIDTFPEVHVDFGHGTDIDSSGLALMLAWLRYAQSHQKAIYFHGVSSSVRDVAVVCNLEQILGL